jgi:4-amino-4-deoxychorismate lyase
MIDVLPEDAPAASIESSVHRVDGQTPTLDVRDLGAARGDGVFETLGVVGGRPQALDAHLARLANSASLLDLPVPNDAQWRHAITVAAASLPADRQGGLKVVLTRGAEGGSRPTGWIVATPADGDFAERETGISVVTLDRGYSSDVAQRAPWLLAGAKTLSYAVNMAALREARRRGADDVIFLTSDGFVMEAPTSTVILRLGDRIVTPRTDIGILPGTSQLSVFEFAADQGLRTEEALVPASDLTRADALWLVSSVRLAVPVTSVDGADVPVDLELTRAMNAALLARRN